MKSFLAVLAAAALACAVAAPAFAMPTDHGPRVVAHVRHAAPVAPIGDDVATGAVALDEPMTQIDNDPREEPGFGNAQEQASRVELDGRADESD